MRRDKASEEDVYKRQGSSGAAAGLLEIFDDRLGPRPDVQLAVDVLEVAVEDVYKRQTHEEVITPLMKNEISSYRDLPKTFFQIGTKFRHFRLRCDDFAKPLSVQIDFW